MSSTFSNLKFELIGNGEQLGQWGTTTNSNLGTAIEQAIVGMATLTSANFTTNVATLTLADLSPPTAQDARALCLNISAGAVSAAGTINVPAIQKPYIIINGSSFAVTVKVSGLTGVAVPSGKRTVVYNNGTDVGNQIDYLSSLTLLTALPVASGGTGTATPALVAGSNVTITGTWPNQTIAAAAPGTGTVTSVGGTGTVNGITLTGTVTSTGNLTLGGALSGVNLASQVTGTLPVANGGTGQTTLTGLPLPQPVITQNVQVIGTNTTAVASRIYVLTASLTLTLPASPTAGNTVAVSNMSGVLTAVIGRNSQPIMALAEDLTVNLDGAGFTLVYADATRGWVLLP
jgi:hypothetical protein